MDELAQLKAKVEELTKQIQGVAAERNGLRDQLGQAQAQIQSFQSTTNRPATMTGYGHPFGELFQDPSVVDNWLKSQVTGLLGQQNFVTQDAINQLVQMAAQQAYDSARQDALLWRNFDRFTAKEVPGADGKPTKPYAELMNPDSPFAKEVVKVLQEKKWGMPMHEKARDLATEYRFADPMSLEWAADLARMNMEAQAKASAAASAQAQATQQAAGLGQTPANAGSGPVPTGQPDFSKASSVDDVIAQLGNALEASPSTP